MTDHASLAAAARLSDRELLDATARAAADERRVTSELIALLTELDSRRLYLGEGYSSLFMYCRHRLHLSEFAAYGRITAARAARRFPIVLARLAEGGITLTSLGLLAPHLTEENYEALLDAAQHASKRDVERLVASLYGQPDIPTTLRRLPVTEVVSSQAPPPGEEAVQSPAGRRDEASSADGPDSAATGTPASEPTPRRASVGPLAVDRYLLRVTIGAETHARLDRARDLLRHVVPDGDIALILDRALAVLVDQLERRKTGRLSGQTRARPPSGASRGGQTRGASPRGRHIPAAVRREVWNRDEGRCAFIGSDGRCRETGFLEYHHIVAFAKGGATDVANLELRCRAHNAYEAEREFGERAPTSSAGISRTPSS